MKSLVTRLFSDSFIRHNAIFFVGSMVVAVLNYLYHPILSRLMDVEHFGEVQLLLSLVAQIGVIMTVFGIIALNIYANTESDSHDREDVAGMLHAIALYLMLAIAIGTVVLSPWLAKIFKFSSSWPFVVLAVSFIFSVPIAFRLRFLQAIHDFTRNSLGSAIGALGKLVLGVGFVVLGFSTMGAIAGYVIATSVMFVFLWHKTHGKVHLPWLHRIQWSPLLRGELVFGFLVFTTTSLVTFLSTADIIFIKYLFSPEVAGEYSGVATVARMIFFATASIAGVLMAHIKLKNAPHDNTRILKKALVMTGLIGGTGVLLFSIFPSTIVSILVGNQYLPASPLLPKLSLVLFAVALMQLLFMFFLSLRKSIGVYIAIIGTLCVFVLTWMYHATPTEIVTNFLVASTLTLALQLLALIHYTKTNGTRIEITETGTSPQPTPQTR